MPAYLVGWVKVKDPAGMKEYAAGSHPSIHAYGGKILWAGPPAAALEGEFDAHGLAVVEFPSQEALQQWYDSPEYAEWLDLRKRSADSVMLATPEAPAGGMA